MRCGATSIKLSHAPMTDTYHTAQALSADLAEDELVDGMTDMFVPVAEARPRAQAIRARSEAQKWWSGGVNQTPEDRFHFTQSSLYGAIYTLLEGYKGYKLVRMDDSGFAPPT